MKCELCHIEKRGVMFSQFSDMSTAIVCLKCFNKISEMKKQEYRVCPHCGKGIKDDKKRTR